MINLPLNFPFSNFQMYGILHLPNWGISDESFDDCNVDWFFPFITHEAKRFTAKLLNWHLSQKFLVVTVGRNPGPFRDWNKMLKINSFLFLVFFSLPERVSGDTAQQVPTVDVLQGHVSLQTDKWFKSWLGTDMLTSSSEHSARTVPLTDRSSSPRHSQIRKSLFWKREKMIYVSSPSSPGLGSCQSPARAGVGVTGPCRSPG